MTRAHGSEVVAEHMIKICPNQISFQDKKKPQWKWKRCVYFLILAIFCIFQFLWLYNNILIKTVETVRTTWEVAYMYFYCENKASIFDAKIQVNLCFRRNMQVGRRHAKWKVFCYKKEMDK